MGSLGLSFMQFVGLAIGFGISSLLCLLMIKAVEQQNKKRGL